MTDSTKISNIDKQTTNARGNANLVTQGGSFFFFVHFIIDSTLLLLYFSKLS